MNSFKLQKCMFIEVNGRILDKREYERELLLLKRLVEYEFFESMAKYGFITNKKHHFVHEKSGLEIELKFLYAKQKPL